MLQLYLFGAPRLVLHGQPVALRRTKALALLIYLAVTRQPHEREALIALLWPEFDAASARNNLRRELSLLRSTLGDAALNADRQQIAWNNAVPLWVDVGAFRELLAAAQQTQPATPAWAAALAEAVALADAELLAGFGLADSPAFEEWLFFQRESVQQTLIEALDALVAWHRDAAAHAAALPYARRRIVLDPLDEAAQRDLIRLYAFDGQHAAALRQYDACVRLLDAELGAVPEPETLELGALVRARRLIPVALAQSAPPAADDAAGLLPPVEAPPPEPAPSLALPPLTVGFVGRRRELADLLRRLTDPDCRLLTLAGPGGVGKTQLALHAAHRLYADLAGSPLIRDGIVWVDLLPVAEPGGITAAIAAALGFSFTPGGQPQAQLLAYLRDRQLFLVLDNLEHLLEDISLLAEVLATAPGVRLLVTSRSALNVPGEWFHPLDGLSFPADSTADAQLAQYDAVRLFEHLARRARSDVRLSSAAAPMIRLCRLVEGMPLALELAAGWLKTLTVEQVVAAIERDPALLSSRDRTLPNRHRNLRTVFAETWRMLTEAEQATLAGLTVFVGEFTPEAAQAVTDAGLETLAALVDRSLVRTVPNGRLRLHELLRQFVAAEAPAVRENAQARHSAYYLALLAEREPLLMEHGWQETLAELGPESGNLRAAWLNALAYQRLERLDQALYSMSALIMARNDYREGAELFARTVAAIPADPDAPPIARRVVARALVREGSFRYQLGDNRAAIALLEQGITLAEAAGVQRDRAYGHLLLGRIAGWEGDEPAARRQLERGLELARHLDAGYLITQALPHLAWLYCSYGDFEAGARTAEEGLTWSRRSGRPDLIVRALHMLAWSATCRGAYAVAEPLYRESLALSEALGHRQNTAASLNGLGWTIWCAGGRLDEAQALHERSLAILRELGNGIWISNVLGDMALLALDRDDRAQARALGEEGLRLADTLNNAMYRAYHLGILGHLATLEGRFAAARAALREALHCALSTRLWPKVAFVLYQVALLRCAEADAADAEGRAAALQLFAAVAQHAAVWAVYRRRAAQMLSDMQAHLPADLAAAAIARGRDLDWATGLTDLFELQP